MSEPDPDFRTRVGVPLTIMPISATDHDDLHRAFLKLSPTSRYLRFLGVVNDLGPDELRRLTDVDHRMHEALIAKADDGDLVGVARFIRKEPGERSAEVALTVADDWQGQGIGTELLHRLASRAVEEGVEVFTATCFVENSGMLEVFRKLPGARCHEKAPLAGVVRVELALGPAEPATDLAAAVRVGASAFSGTEPPP